MLKNKFKIITLLLVIILCISAPFVRAENENALENSEVMLINEDSDVMAIDENADAEHNHNHSEDASTGSTEVNQDNMKKHDVYLAGDEITIDYIVDGNLFIFANKVTINSQIGGDAFICANTLTIGEQGYIYSNLFTVAQDINISGVVYDLYALSNNITISGYIYRDIKANCTNLNLYGAVGRNAFVGISNIDFINEEKVEESDVSSNGVIGGDLNYEAESEISIPEGYVNGSVNYTAPSVNENTGFDIQHVIMNCGTFIASTIIIWLLLLWLAPKFLTNTTDLISKKFLPIIGIGIITPIVSAVAFIILLLLGITSNIALLLISLLLILMFISSSIFVIAINNILCKKLKVEKTIGKFGILIISSLVLTLIQLIPYIGAIVAFIASIIGIGIVVLGIIPSKKEIKE